MSRWLSMAVVVLLGLAGASPALAQEAFVGTWKHNPALSKRDPPSRGPEPSIVRTYELFGDGLKYAGEMVFPDGKRTTTSWSGHFDGKDYPCACAPADTVALKRLDAFSHELTFKKAGKVTNIHTVVISKDGKTLTVNGRTPDGADQRITGAQVYEKQ